MLGLHVRTVHGVLEKTKPTKCYICKLTVHKRKEHDKNGKEPAAELDDEVLLRLQNDKVAVCTRQANKTVKNEVWCKWGSTSTHSC